VVISVEGFWMILSPVVAHFCTNLFDLSGLVDWSVNFNCSNLKLSVCYFIYFCCVILKPFPVGIIVFIWGLVFGFGMVADFGMST
jgi:hypothetical protein